MLHFTQLMLKIYEYTKSLLALGDFCEKADLCDFTVIYTRSSFKMGFGQARNSEIYLYITGAFPSMTATSTEVAVYIHTYLNV